MDNSESWFRLPEGRRWCRGQPARWARYCRRLGSNGQCSSSISQGRREASNATMSIDPKHSNLLDFIKENYLDPKIIGEDNNKQLLFLICASARTRNPLSAIVKGPSGAGKSHLVNRVLDPFRKMGIVIEFSRITGAYLENMAKEDLAIPKPVMRKEITKEEYEDQLKRYREQPRIADLTGKILF